MKECLTCHNILPDTEFPYRKHSKTYRKSCRKCENEARKSRAYLKSEAARRNRNEYEKERQKRQRKDPKYLTKIIVQDAKRSDKKHKRGNDLTREFVAKIILDGCCYCSDNSIRMTLDRIDNTIGHIESNVVAACYRCNMLRGNMPYRAWLNIVPAIKDTLKKGLFENWSGWGPWKLAGSGRT